jgi:hypothetical protein
MVATRSTQKGRPAPVPSGAPGGSTLVVVVSQGDTVARADKTERRGAMTAEGKGEKRSESSLRWKEEISIVLR